MTLLRKLQLAFIGVAILAAVGVVIRVPTPSLGENFGRRVEERLGITLTASRSSFSVTRGMLLEGVRVVASQERMTLSAEIDQLVARHRLSLQWPPRVERIRLIRPTLIAVVGEQGGGAAGQTRSQSESSEPAEQAPVEDAPGAGVMGAPSGTLGIDIELAIIELSAPGANAFPLEADGLDVVLTNVGHDAGAQSLLEGLGGAGTVSARQLGIGGVTVSDASGALTLGGGHVVFSELTFWCDGKEYLLPEVDIDFTSEPFSVGTRSNILERVESEDDAPAEWVPVVSLTRLDGLCDG